MLENCKIIEIPKIPNPAGSLCVVENDKGFPFEVKRVYYVYDIPGGSERGGHAHRVLHQVIIALMGSFDVLLDDGEINQGFHLARPHIGLYVCPMVWRELDNFSTNSICLVLASEVYDEADYYRDYSQFVLANKVSTRSRAVQIKSPSRLHTR